MRRRTRALLTLIGTCTFAALVVLPASPQEKKGQDERDKRVKAALDLMVKAQRPDGRWNTGMGENRPAIVVTASFCGLALLASGDDKYIPVVDKAAIYVAQNIFQDLSRVKPPEGLDQGNWKVGIGGLFLCEYYAILKKKKRGYKNPTFQKGIEAIPEEGFKRMEPSGGWGHTPRVKNPLGYIELEVMGNWMLASFGAARSFGAKVPEDKLKTALGFIEESSSEEGGVGYSPREGQKGFGDPCRTGGAIFALTLLGKTDHPAYPKMVEYWRKTMEDSAEGHGSLAMGLLCSALAARCAGEKDWSAFSEKFFPRILEAAKEDGSFGEIKGTKPQALAGADGQVGAAYTTGIYALILQLDRGHLRFMSPAPPDPEDTRAAEEARRLATELQDADGGKAPQALAKLKEAKGAAYTEALAGAIPKLDGDMKKRAREALADRMSRMTSATLADKLADDDAEVRRAAVMAAAMKERKEHIGRLIELLEDESPDVPPAAHAALKSLTGKDFGPAKDASPVKRAEAIAAWKLWWTKQHRQ